ncbi:class I glutamine amidotransferase-like protein [Talaromyces proteolyticus]|uniref:Class I glutamine amidotransferase-like protein n=1 Tax=Talaromyces proteolyticus TaxID=1131652 RepID=A0AAD4L150_9EURO|nr:class I glutamine amidotransferase-like protein [Talaromyces proteolyticus]KAH8705648.1 class I glutamine amidotransferase-like protein [Talaromyces proteolyticus]
MPISVAILIYKDVDILDFAGPLGILSSSVLNGAFSFTIIAQSEVTQTCCHVRVPRDVSIEEAHENLHNFHILLVPGASIEGSVAIARNADSPELRFVKAFSEQKADLGGSDPRPRTMFSVCSGALILGAAGVLVGKTATTHHLCLNLLREQCAVHQGYTNVVHSRYEDGGLTENGIRVLTAGGVSSGMDAACYLIAKELSIRDADAAAKMNEYEWQKDKALFSTS